LALTLSIADGFLHSSEKDMIQKHVKEWIPNLTPTEYAGLVETVYVQIRSAKMGVDLLDGVQQSAKHIYKELEGDKKKLYRIIKQLKSLAEVDSESNKVSEPELRILRFVSRGFGLGKKLRIRLEDEQISLVRI
jgi:uncharacterized protein YhbP (UPF0306 family)